MGLDMFLYKVKREEVGYWRKANAIHKWFEDRCAEGNCENCQEYRVSKEDLIDLRNTCKSIIDESKLVLGKIVCGYSFDENGNEVPIYRQGKVIENPELAQELLPSQRGPFFGSTNYDESYLNDLKVTVEQIDEILATTDFEVEDIVYYAWW